MLILGHKNFEVHRKWAYFVLAATILFSLWFITGWIQTGRWPSGGSLEGLTAGVVAGLIMFFEMFLWPRKTVFRAWRIGRTKYWLKAHIWLGLLCLPLGLLHGGFHFSMANAPLAGMLSWLTLIVVSSGAFGLYIQNVIPRMMLETLPGETIVNQIPEVLDSYRNEVNQMIRETCGLADANTDPTLSGEISIVSSVKTSGSISGRTMQTHTPYPFIQGCEPLLTFWETYGEPFLKPGKMQASGLADKKSSEALFQSLSEKIPVEAQNMIERLKAICDQRRQFDRQLSLHFWLHSWLVGHVAISVALMIVLILHMTLALQYP